MKRLIFLSLTPLLLSAGNLVNLLELAEQNHQIEASKHYLEAAKAKESSVTSSYLPSITIGGNYIENSEHNVFSYTRNTTGYAKASLVLYDGGKREALMDQQEAQVKSASYALAATHENVFLNIINQYYSYLNMLSLEESTLQKIEQLEAEQYRLKQYFSVGSATADEVQRIISSVEQAKVDLIDIKNNLAMILNALEYLVGTRVEVEAGSSIAFHIPKEPQTRQDILALEENVNSARADVDVAKSPYLPTIAIEDTYSHYDYNKEYTMGLDKQNTVMLSLQWKIFDFGATSSTKEAAHRNFLAKSSELAYEKSRAKASLNNAQNSYKSALLKIDAAKSRLRAADMTYDLVRKKFQMGIVNNVSYLDALSEKYSAKAGLQSALNDLEYQKAVVLYEMGKEIKGAIQ